MSLAHAPKTTCPRCLELRPSEIHTCAPTDRWRELESERDRYREALEKIATCEMDRYQLVQIAIEATRD